MTSFLPQEKELKSSGHESCKDLAEAIYPTCRTNVGSNAWQELIDLSAKDPTPEAFPHLIALQRDELDLPEYLAALARLEWAIHQVKTEGPKIPSTVEKLILNPTVQLLQLSWKNLPAMLNGKVSPSLKTPEPGEELVVVWRDPGTRQANATSATDEDLLVLKIIVEGIDPETVAVTGELPVGAVDAAIRRAASRGVLLAPRSRIRRDSSGEIRLTFQQPTKQTNAFCLLLSLPFNGTSHKHAIFTVSTVTIEAIVPLSSWIRAFESSMTFAISAKTDTCGGRSLSPAATPFCIPISLSFTRPRQNEDLWWLYWATRPPENRWKTCWQFSGPSFFR
jgi:hypothetical protein